ncbi:MAG: alkyldihydroxyacetonephosphate synthase [Candidatus Binatia bacterium]|nr:MAG: alkyldihydroxyacetonephosphate synthase [Candidatus Binatia bacterium]
MLETDRQLHRERLQQLLGDERVVFDEVVLQAHRKDTWFLNVYRASRGRLNVLPLAVVYPDSVEQVQEVVRYALAYKLPVVPFGGGSGVCGAIEPSAQAIVVDLRRMDRVVELNERALFARVQAGKMGEALEEELNQLGFTCGHFPQSIALSTVGGWVSTRAAGQYSTRYGNIEDLVLGLDVVLPDGRLLRLPPRVRWGSGPDLRQVFLGAEGTLGIVTEVTLKVFPVPESALLQSFSFPDMATGLEAIRCIVRAGWRPPVVRLYDAVESARHFPEASSGADCLLLLISEGPGALTAAEAAACAGVCAALGGQDRGPDPVERWIQERNRVPTFESLIEKGLVADTIEVSATWDRIAAVYQEVIAALQRVPGVLLASGHSSHSYPQGTNLYFTFAARPASAEAGEHVYLDCWRAAMEATLQAGGSVVHHHGIGRVRKAWLVHELGEGVDVLRALKLALDPAGLFNPGALLPDS